MVTICFPIAWVFPIFGILDPDASAEKTQEYSVVLGAIEDVLQDVSQINLDSDAAKRWMAEHIVWKIWKNNKDVPVQS